MQQHHCVKETQTSDQLMPMDTHGTHWIMHINRRTVGSTQSHSWMPSVISTGDSCHWPSWMAAGHVLLRSCLAMLDILWWNFLIRVWNDVPEKSTLIVGDNLMTFTLSWRCLEFSSTVLTTPSQYYLHWNGWDIFLCGNYAFHTWTGDCIQPLKDMKELYLAHVVIA